MSKELIAQVLGLLCGQTKRNIDVYRYCRDSLVVCFVHCDHRNNKLHETQTQFQISGEVITE